MQYLYSSKTTSYSKFGQHPQRQPCFNEVSHVWQHTGDVILTYITPTTNISEMAIFLDVGIWSFQMIG
jgi:hypothetical protein